MNDKENQQAVFKMGLIDDLIGKIDSQKFALNALAAASSNFEPAREAIIMKLKDFDLTLAL